MRVFYMAIAIALCGFVSFSRAGVYISGHSDVGVAFEDGELHMHLHADGPLNLFGGGTLTAGEYDPDAVIIGVPTPTLSRPSSSAWSFLAPNAGDTVWFLPQSSSSTKPFLGFSAEELAAGAGWSNVTWKFNSITTVLGANSAFSLYQTDGTGNPVVFASSLVPTGTMNSWVQPLGGHDHYNWAFTGEGVYDVNFTVEASNNGSGSIPLGNYSDTASFRFAVGSFISAVPEPSSLMLTGIAFVGLGLWRRRRS